MKFAKLNFGVGKLYVGRCAQPGCKRSTMKGFEHCFFCRSRLTMQKRPNTSYELEDERMTIVHVVRHCMTRTMDRQWLC